VSGHSADQKERAERKDPLVRFVVGCAIVAAILGALAVAMVALVGWQLTRDVSPERPPETFLVGDETRYFRLDLKPGDPGMVALFEHLEAINDATRHDLLRGTFLESLPLPRRRARLDQLAPLTLEVAIAMTDPSSGLQKAKTWAARGTFSHGVLGMRATIAMMRWAFTHKSSKGRATVVDGVDVTEVRDAETQFAVATLGNRLIVASDEDRMRSVLAAATPSQRGGRAEVSALEDAVKLEGENARGFVSRLRTGDLANPVLIDAAAASFDVNDHDELVFRIAVRDNPAGEERKLFRGTREECIALASVFLPGIPEEAITLDGDGAQRIASGPLTFTGRIPGLSTRIAAWVAQATAHPGRGRLHWSTGWEMPFAIPPPPSPPPPSGPRTGTPAAPPREETPKPPR
jgi:hypothetical protein